MTQGQIFSSLAPRLTLWALPTDPEQCHLTSLEMDNRKRLAYAIIQFLHGQLRHGGLSSDAQESLEGKLGFCPASLCQGSDTTASLPVGSSLQGSCTLPWLTVRVVGI